MQITRRKMIIAGLACSGAVAADQLWPWTGPGPDRSLSIFVPATGEREKITYWSGGTYLSDGISAMNWILRDFKSNIVGGVDLRLLDTLHAMMSSSEVDRELEIVRGHITNDPNQRFVPGSPNSYHNDGQAVDVRVEGVSLWHLVDDFSRWFDGGVGVYQKKNFVHLDIGPPRRWIV